MVSNFLNDGKQAESSVKFLLVSDIRGCEIINTVKIVCYNNL